MRKAFTLTEVMVGAVLLSGVFAALLTSFVSVRRYVKRANQRLIASDLATRQLNDLYRAVREDTWDSGYLSTGSINLNSYTIDNQVYQDPAQPNRYTVVDVGDYRRVSVRINYP